jgi:predicted dehydrogenase
MEQLRIGTLSTARITPAALIAPARQARGTVVTAVAARDPARAEAFAAAHGIPVVHESYQALIADPDIDAVYNPLPNSLHAETTYLGQLRAFAAAVPHGEPFPTTPEHAVVTMELIDDIYRAAGLPPRP